MPVQEIDRAVPTAATAGEIPQGETIGRYVVLREIGRGGMGEVYEAFDPQLERRVALKLILVGPSPDMTTGTSVDNSMAHAMLIAEAQSQAKLAHPNIV